jgi:putative endonuclease
VSTATRAGRDAETRAAAFLTGQGLKLLDTNFRCRGGEIDLVLRDGEHLVFVEVRYRRSAAFGSPLESVDARKQQRIMLAARHYLARRGNRDACRFDVVGMDGSGRLEWVKDAFSA